ncbi:hypothetical protein FOA43_000565 [Brettanomyces nanus]|uniref:Uncharacterized protein n=1 Tax=Eeniella nana TaxID=13502 RepID=A0A875RT90_EENNA|nr:uncharacterized protein FOA43_000565 [Brettanomyces nanus]QPG73257.1 hypothetical protein FOA43_000565 [Brettanomyces nanus]
MISRAVGCQSPDQVHWSKSGEVFMLFKKELLLLKTKKEADIDASDLSGMFTSYRFAGTLMDWENMLISVLSDNEVVRVGQAKRHSQGQQNENNLIEIDCSELGVDLSCQTLIAGVTDSFNGYLMREVHGDLKLQCLLNERIAVLEGGIDTSKVLTLSQLTKLRIHSIAWTGKIDFEYIGIPVWPIVAESAFVVMTESSTTWFYMMSEDGNPKRLFSFETGLTVAKDGDEYVRKCKISDWIKDSGSDFVIAYLLMITTRNRVLLRQLRFSSGTKTLEMNSEFSETINGAQGIISTADFKKLGKHLQMLTILSTDKLQFVALNAKGIDERRETSLFGTRIQCTSMVQFVTSREADYHIILHTVVANPHRDLLYLKVDIPSLNSFSQAGPIVGKKYNYRKELPVDELPLFEKLNELREVSIFRILSLSLDPSGKFIGLLSSIYDPDQPIDGRIVSHREDVEFSVIPAYAKGNTFDTLLDIDTFNSVQSAPVLRIQSYHFLRSVLPEEDKTFELGEDSRASDHVVFEKKIDPESCLQQNLILSSLSDKVRLTNTFNDHAANKSNLERLAKIVVEMVRTGRIEISSEYDQLMCQQYLRLLGLAAPKGFWGKYESRHKIRIPIPGLPDTWETFAIGSTGNSPDHEGKLQPLLLRKDIVGRRAS